MWLCSYSQCSWKRISFTSSNDESLLHYNFQLILARRFFGLLNALYLTQINIYECISYAIISLNSNHLYKWKNWSREELKSLDWTGITIFVVFIYLLNTLQSTCGRKRLYTCSRGNRKIKSLLYRVWWKLFNLWDCWFN